jgi:hypothetical protein
MLVFSVCGLQQGFDDILRMIIYFCSYTDLLLGGLPLQGSSINIISVDRLKKRYYVSRS